MKHIIKNAEDKVVVWDTQATPEGIYFYANDTLMMWVEEDVLYINDKETPTARIVENEYGIGFDIIGG